MGWLVNGLEKRKAKIVATAMPYLEAGETFGVAAIVQTEKQQAQTLSGKTPWTQFLLVATDRSLHLFGISPIKNEVTQHMDRIPIATAQVAMAGDSIVVGPAYLAPLTVEPRLPEVAAWVQQRQAPAAAAAPPPPPPPPPAAVHQGFVPPPHP